MMSTEREIQSEESDRTPRPEFEIHSLEPRLLMSATWVEPDIDDQAEEEQQEEDGDESGRLSQHGSGLLEAMDASDGLFETAGELVESGDSVGDGQSGESQRERLRGGSEDDRDDDDSGNDRGRDDRDRDDRDRDDRGRAEDEQDSEPAVDAAANNVSEDSDEDTSSGLQFSGGTVSENAGGGVVVGSAAVEDVDQGETYVYELVNDAEGRFSINAETGEISVTDGADLNYEADTQHEVEVRVTDSEGESVEGTMEIEVANVDEVFVLSGNNTLSADDGPYDTVVINGGYLDIDGDVEIQGDLVIENAARINGGELHVSGNVTTTDTGYHGSATIVLDGAGAQTISANGGTGELHRVSIENASGEVTISDAIQISGSYDDNGNAVDASGAAIEIQGNGSVSGSGTTFGDVTVNGGYVELSDMDIDGDLTITKVTRINGGIVRVAGEIDMVDSSWHGTGDIVAGIPGDSVADEAVVSVASSVSGGEDSAIRIPIEASLTDTDGSEALTIEIANAPQGATLSDGVTEVLPATEAPDTPAASNEPVPVETATAPTLEPVAVESSSAEPDSGASPAATADHASEQDGPVVTSGAAEQPSAGMPELVEPLDAAVTEPAATPSAGAVLPATEASDTPAASNEPVPAATATAPTLEPVAAESSSAELDAGAAPSVTVADTSVPRGFVVTSGAAEQPPAGMPESVPPLGTPVTEPAEESEDSRERADAAAAERVMPSEDGVFRIEHPADNAEYTIDGRGYSGVLELNRVSLDQIRLDADTIHVQDGDGRGYSIQHSGIHRLQLHDVQLELPDTFDVGSEHDSPGTSLRYGSELAVELPRDLPEIDGVETVLVSGVPVDGILNHGWRVGDDTWVVPPRHLHSLALRMPVNAAGHAKMKFELFGSVTSSFTATAAVASDYEVTSVTEVIPDELIPGRS